MIICKIENEPIALMIFTKMKLITMATKKTNTKAKETKEETKVEEVKVEEVKKPEATTAPVDPNTLSPFGKLMNGLGFLD